MGDAGKGQAASYSRLRFGAFVPAAEHDFGCVDQLHGGERGLKEAGLDPAGEVV
jgi:hypothetical protein